MDTVLQDLVVSQSGLYSRYWMHPLLCKSLKAEVSLIRQNFKNERIEYKYTPLNIKHEDINDSDSELDIENYQERSYIHQVGKFSRQEMFYETNEIEKQLLREREVILDSSPEFSLHFESSIYP